MALWPLTPTQKRNDLKMFIFRHQTVSLFEEVDQLWSATPGPSPAESRAICGEKMWDDWIPDERRAALEPWDADELAQDCLTSP